VTVNSSILYLSKLTKFGLIITIFDHNCVYLNSKLMRFHIKCSARYSTVVYTTTMGVNSIMFLQFDQFYKKVVLRLGEHGDVIETQAIRFVPPKFFSKLGPGSKSCLLNAKFMCKVTKGPSTSLMCRQRTI